jgi:hypothetical protein
MASPDTSAHQPGHPRGEDIATTDHEGRDGDRRNERDSTGINPDARRPILPSMGDLPPA